MGADAVTYFWGAGNAVHQRLRTGGVPSVAATFPALERCTTLAIAPEHISCGVWGSSADGVYQAPLSGGALTLVVPEPLTSVFSATNDVMWVGSARLGVSESARSEPTVLLSHQNEISPALFADTSAVYWRGGLNRVDLASHAQRELAQASFGEVGMAAGISDGTYA